MNVPISIAGRQLPDLVRRAEAGEEIVLTRDGRAAVTLVPVRRAPDATTRRALIDAVRASACVEDRAGGPDAARSQDFLYDEAGIPK